MSGFFLLIMCGKTQVEITVDMVVERRQWTVKNQSRSVSKDEQLAECVRGRRKEQKKEDSSEVLSYR